MISPYFSSLILQGINSVTGVFTLFNLLTDLPVPFVVDYFEYSDTMDNLILFNEERTIHGVYPIEYSGYNPQNGCNVFYSYNSCVMFLAGENSFSVHPNTPFSSVIPFLGLVSSLPPIGLCHSLVYFSSFALQCIDPTTGVFTLLNLLTDLTVPFTADYFDYDEAGKTLALFNRERTIHGLYPIDFCGYCSRTDSEVFYNIGIRTKFVAGPDSFSVIPNTSPSSVIPSLR